MTHRASRALFAGLLSLLLSVVGVGPVVTTAWATGSTWRILAVPGDGDALVGVHCYSANACIGVSIGSSQVSTSHDGGRHWRAQPGPSFARLGFTSLYCDRTGYCVATATWGGSIPSGAVAASSSDGGLHWRQLLIRKTPGNLNYRFNDAWCSSPAHCMVAGTTGTRGFVLLTTNAGRTWFPSLLPPQPAQGSIASLTCTSSTDCLATQGSAAQIYVSHNAGRSWTALPPPTTFHSVLAERGVVTGLTAISCGAPTLCVAGGYIAHTQLQSTTEPFKWVSNDAGTTWHFDQPFAVTGAKSPAAVANGAIACVSSRVCTIGLSYGNIYVTRDGGTTWRRDVGAPALDSNVLSLSCPTVTRCVAAVISNFPSQRLLAGSMWVNS